MNVTHEIHHLTEHSIKPIEIRASLPMFVSFEWSDCECFRNISFVAEQDVVLSCMTYLGDVGSKKKKPESIKASAEMNGGGGYIG